MYKEKGYILTGVFQTFGLKSNGRIYRMEDFIPQLRRLKCQVRIAKIKKIFNSLL
jgi:hypothetical protein